MDQGFVLTRSDDGGLDFDLRTRWSADIRAAFDASGADGLVANYARGFIGHDIEFVRDLPLRRLDVLARTVTDLSPINDLSGSLEQLHCRPGPRRVSICMRCRCFGCCRARGAK